MSRLGLNDWSGNQSVECPTLIDGQHVPVSWWRYRVREGAMPKMVSNLLAHRWTGKTTNLPREAYP